MPRVWKYFLKNLSWPLGFATYIATVSVGAAYANIIFNGGGAVVAIVFVGLPVGVYLIRDMWLDAKRKVEWENEDLLRKIRGD